MAYDKKKISVADNLTVKNKLVVVGTLTAADIVVTDDQTLTDDLTVEGTINANGGLVTDTIAEETSAAGVTIDGVLLKDGGAVFADAATIEVDTINEATSAAGVTVDGVLLKDGLVGSQQVISGDGAITLVNRGTVILTKGSAAAITIAAPTVTTHDYWEITVISTTAFAHVITQGTVGFNAKGSSGTATYGTARGNAVTLVAYQGNWYSKSSIGITFA